MKLKLSRTLGMELNKLIVDFQRHQIRRIIKTPSRLLGVLVFGIGLFLASKFWAINYNLLVKNLIAPPQGIEYFSFGFQETIADSLWIRVIQDFDYCDQPVTAQHCRGQSWLYQMLDVTTNLSPHFRMPYATGPIALSVLITDVDGATKLFEKGIKAFPNDWPIAYRAAYHFLYEVHDKKRAGQLLLQAEKNGGPQWLSSLANRLYVDSGNTDLAEALLRDMIRQNAEPQLIKRMQEKIDSFKRNPKK